MKYEKQLRNDVTQKTKMQHIACFSEGHQRERKNFIKNCGSKDERLRLTKNCIRRQKWSIR